MHWKFDVCHGYRYYDSIDKPPKEEFLNLYRLKYDDIALSREQSMFHADGVANSLVITLYDDRYRNGIMAHITGFDSAPDFLRPENIVNTMLTTLAENDSLDYSKLEATLSGEGAIEYKPQIKSVIVREQLNKHNIKIIAEDLDRGFYKTVYMKPSIGKVFVHRTSTCYYNEELKNIK